ncbi:replication-relaxation family protein [Peribacillus sp. NPDC097198]|uniref:replication-relaxation family protein n=1 Tax=Peribacillus sp. NPDC097198 TaxID=3364397 RepID=UPI0037F7503C
MKKRDLEILSSLEKFKCLTRDQIAALHFSANARPHVSANNVLKRLRRDGYITANTDRSFHQYIYFNAPSPIKTDSQKIGHYLMINQGFIDMGKYGAVNRYEIEPSIENAEFIPDVSCNWLDIDWYLEFQNSLYTTKQMYSKLDKYSNYYYKGEWKAGRLLIIGKINMQFKAEDYPFKVKQINSIDDLKEDILSMREVRLREFKGEAKTVRVRPELAKISSDNSGKLELHIR